MISELTPIFLPAALRQRLSASRRSGTLVRDVGSLVGKAERRFGPADGLQQPGGMPRNWRGALILNPGLVPPASGAAIRAYRHQGLVVDHLECRQIWRWRPGGLGTGTAHSGWRPGCGVRSGRRAGAPNRCRARSSAHVAVYQAQALEILLGQRPAAPFFHGSLQAVAQGDQVMGIQPGIGQQVGG